MIFYNILLSGGNSQRFGTNKQFFLLDNKPLFIHSLEKFINLAPKTILVVKEKLKSKYEKIINNYDLNCENLTIISGGDSRQESVLLALNSMKKKEQDFLVSVHDCARPYLDKATLLELYSFALKYKNVVIAKKMINSLKSYDRENELITQSYNREIFCTSETPQIFSYKLLQNGYNYCYDNNILCQDEVQAIQEYSPNTNIKIFFSLTKNNKITFPNDAV